MAPPLSRGPRIAWRTATIVLAALVAIAAISPAATLAIGWIGDQYTPTNSSKIYTSGATYQYAFASATNPPTWMREEITAQMNAQNGNRQGTNLPKFALSGSTTGAEIIFKYGVPSMSAQDHCNTAAALACAVSNDSTSATNDRWVFFAKDINDGSAYTWQKWCQWNDTTAANYREGCYDARNVTLHETGHVKGLSHFDAGATEKPETLGPGAAITVMQVQSRAHYDAGKDGDGFSHAGWDAHVYGACDIGGLQIDYGLEAASSKLSQCLARLTTSLTLARSPSHVAYRGTVNFTATLEINSTAYGSAFDGQNLSSRVVKLYRSLNGGTTWTLWATMSPGSTVGTYTYSYTGATTPLHWKAVFAQPTDEALKGDTSNVVTYTVAPCSIAPCPI